MAVDLVAHGVLHRKDVQKPAATDRLRVAKLRAVMRDRLGAAAFDGETAAGRPPRDDLIMIRVVDTADGGARSGRLRETLRASVAAVDVDVVRSLRVIGALPAPRPAEDMDHAVIRPAFETVGRQDDVTSKMLDAHFLRLAAVHDDVRAVVVVHHQLRPFVALVDQRLGCRPQPPARIRVADARHGGLRVAGRQLLDEEVAPHRHPHAAFADQEARMPESDRRRQEAVDAHFQFIRRAAERLAFLIEHGGAADAEIALLVMDFVQIEIDEPRAVRQAVSAVLRVVSVRQAAVEAEMRPFGIDGSVPGLFLHQHDFAESVEDLREGSRARHAIVVITTAPRRDGRMDVAVRRAEMELVLDDRRQFFGVFHCAQRLWRIATPPGVHQLVS